MKPWRKLGPLAALIVISMLLASGGGLAQAQDPLPPRQPAPPDWVVDPAAGAALSVPAAPVIVPGEWYQLAIEDSPWVPIENTSVWTGQEWIMWGGYPFYQNESAGRYNPSTNTWRSINSNGAPQNRFEHVAVWTGSEMLIWGGFKLPYEFDILHTGGRYDPATDSWATMAVPTTIFRGDRAIWTGDRMLVMDLEGNGGLYDPRTDQWQPVPSRPPAHTSFTMVMAWTGTEAIVLYFYRTNGTQSYLEGGRYDPAANRWKPVSALNAPSVSINPAAIWTGTALYVLGGLDDQTHAPLTEGGYYQPQTDTWTNTGAILEGANMGLWTGKFIILLSVWTPSSNGEHRFTLYDPALKKIERILPPLSCDAAFGNAVWTGELLLSWGGHFCGLEGGHKSVMGYRPFDYIDQYAADQDTFIASGHPTDALGDQFFLFSGFDPVAGYDDEHVLAHFPFIPEHRIINAEAWLYLYGYTRDSAPLPTGVHRVTAPWDEFSGWQAVGDAFDPVTMDGEAVGHDFGWHSFDVTGAVTQWRAGAPNYGLMWSTTFGSDRNERVYLARETGYAPQLTVYSDEPYYKFDGALPGAQIQVLPAVQSAVAPAAIHWWGVDTGHGLQSYDVQFAPAPSGPWQDWQTVATGTQAVFAGAPGQTACFRVRARDFINQLGPWSTDSRCTTFGAGPLSLSVFDLQHHPIVSATVQLAPAALADTANPWFSTHAFFLPAAPSIQVTVSKPGFTAPPPAALAVTTAQDYQAILQPLDNVLLNPNFETALAGAWAVTGTLPITRGPAAHSGSFAAQFNPALSAAAGAAQLSQAVQVPAQSSATLSFLYALTTTSPTQNAFSVSIETSATITTVFTAAQPCPAWCHAWVNLAAWQGQPVTVTLSLSQTGGQAAQLAVDEVTLGTSQTPLVSQAAPARVDFGVATPITITGQNFINTTLQLPDAGGPTVFLNNVALATEYVDSHTLTALVPSTMPRGSYYVLVQNPGGYQGAAPIWLVVGHAIYLPIVAALNP